MMPLNNSDADFCPVSLDKKNSTISMIIKTKCNNACRFCTTLHNSDYVDPLFWSVDSYEKIVNTIEKFAGDDYKILRFNAVEPPLHKDIIDIMKYASLEKKFKKIVMCSNGRRFSDEKFTQEAINSGLKEIDILLLGHKPEIHDAITQRRGSFIETIKGIENLLKYGIQKLHIHSLIGNENYLYLQDFIRFLRDKKLLENFIGFGYIEPPSNDLNVYKSLIPKMQKCIESLKISSKSGEDLLLLCDFLVNIIPPCIIKRNIPQWSVNRLKKPVEILNPKLIKRAIKANGKVWISPGRKLKEHQPCHFVGKCSLNTYCPGINPLYIAVFGLNEFKPFKVERK